MKTLPLFVYKTAVLACTAAVLFVGSPAFAAVANKTTVQGYIVTILFFINNVLIPLLFSIALLFFLVNAARYFVMGSGDSGSREKARILALYGIGAFVFLVSIWGLVNMLVGGLDLENGRTQCPDYLGDWCRERADNTARRAY